MRGPVIGAGVTSADLAAVKKVANEASVIANKAMDAIQSVAFTINVVPSQSGRLEYTGAAQSPAWNGYNPEQLTIGGTTSGTAVGTYEATFTPKEDYQWADGTKDAKTVTWKIEPVSIANTPSQNGTLTYTGSAQSPSWSNYDSAKLTLGGVTSGTSAGTYKATFTPKANYQWADGTSAAREVSWTIGKAAGSLSLDHDSLSISKATPGVITVTRPGDGKISALSSAVGVATVSVSGNKVTVTAKAAGSANITISVAAGTNHTAPESKVCVVTINPGIYGAQWDGTSSPAWSRTDDAAGFTDPVPYVSGAKSYGSPFDTLQPWAGMAKSERTGGTMVAIPKFYYKLTKNGNGLKVQIADGPATGFVVSPAHMDRGDGKGERDVVYIGRYHCGTSAYKSVSGQKPKVSITRSTARTSIHNLGANIWQMDFAMRFTLWLLYIVEFAHWDSQSKIGYGCGNNSAVENMGKSDSMPYHTGTMQSSRTTYGVGVQYRWIEGLWDNCLDWMDGCYYNGNGMNVILKPANFSDSSNGTLIGKPSNGWPSAFSVSTSGGFPAFYPTASSGSATTYSCDYWDFGTSYPCLYVGGSCVQDASHGLFYVDYASTSGTGGNVGCRLQELP